MAVRRFTLVDVFTSTRLAGNPLAVVHDADGVADGTMLAFARETHFSETSYVQAATVGGADYRNRIWMPSGEIPFAGHPSLGVAAAVARAHGEATVTYTQQTGSGLQPIEVEDHDGIVRASMLQDPAWFGPELDGAEVFQAVGLHGDDGHPELPCQVLSTGLIHVIAPVRDETVLARVRPDPERLAALLRPHDAVCLYLAATDPDAGAARARSLIDDGKGGEDPATGSAAGPLCAYLAQRTGTLRLTITQGVEMGRGSRIATLLEGDRVRVGGDVVVVVDGTVFLDA
jgi:trans-2,3-dihydro-3-hydroxyanthranilate isomerase